MCILHACTCTHHTWILGCIHNSCMYMYTQQMCVRSCMHAHASIHVHIGCLYMHASYAYIHTCIYIHYMYVYVYWTNVFVFMLALFKTDTCTSDPSCIHGQVLAYIASMFLVKPMRSVQSAIDQVAHQLVKCLTKQYKDQQASFECWWCMIMLLYDNARHCHYSVCMWHG